MATTVVNTIGSGGDYSTAQAWEDASPADLVASNEIWQGELIESVSWPSSGPWLVFAGSTTNADCYKVITAAAGFGFGDNPNKLTNALRPNIDNGILIHATDLRYGRGLVESSEQHAKVVGLQLLSTFATTTLILRSQSSGRALMGINCIIASNTTSYLVGGTGLSNCLVLYQGTRTLDQYVMTGNSNGGFDYCTFASIAPGGATTGILGQYGLTRDIKDCAIFGVVNAFTGTGFDVVNCYTDSAQSNPELTQIPYDTANGSGFEDISSAATADYRIKATSAMVDTGEALPTYPYDIVGTIRDANPDVGCWEYSSGGGSVDHATDGDVEGSTADVTGDSLVTQPATVHASTGAVVGNTANVVGTAKRFLLHTTSGDVVDSTDAAVTGQAELINAVYLHETDGVLTGQLGTVVGTARRFRTHTSSGVLFVTDGNGDVSSIVVGQSEIVSPPGEHETYGVLTGQHGTVVGTAKHLRKHTTTGALAGRTAVVTGDATKFAEHDTSGIIVGYDSKVIGSATNVGSLTLTPADIAAIVAAIKAEIIPVDIVRVNHIDVDGTGSPGDEWGPV